MKVVCAFPNRNSKSQREPFPTVLIARAESTFALVIGPP
ncbi:MAG: hypothetical protein HW416_1616 [Chloroflexi bacterium]|nr:hypothetical protein [Chloroflexota bacterium]